MRAKKSNMRELLDMAKLESVIHQNGVVTTRKYLKTNEDTVRRFLRAYIEGAVLAKKDKAFATKVMAKYLGTNEREVLDDAYERVTLHLEIPPYPTVEGVVAAEDSRKSAAQSRFGETGRFPRCPPGARDREERIYRSVVNVER